MSIYREHYHQTGYDFANDAANHGVLHDSDVQRLYDAAITTEFPSETAYQQGLLPLLWACNSHYLDEHTTDRQAALRGTAFCLADIHYKTGHYEYCLGELKFIEQNLALTDGDEASVDYVQAAIEHVCTFIEPDSPLHVSPVRTEVLCN